MKGSIGMMQVEFKNGSYVQVNQTAKEILWVLLNAKETADWVLIDGHLIQPGEIVCARSLGGSEDD